MKKTCFGCRAFDNSEPFRPICQIGYKLNIYGKPLEPCPKPKTIESFLIQLTIKSANRVSDRLQLDSLKFRYERDFNEKNLF